MFIKDAASILEAKILHLKLTINLSDSKYLTNSKLNFLINKKILINLSNYNICTELINCELISRFPVPEFSNCKLIPYTDSDLSEYKVNDLSYKILTNELLEDTNSVNEVINKKFLLGVDLEIDGYDTLIGKLIKVTNNNLKNSKNE